MGRGKGSALYMIKVSIQSKKWYKHTQTKFMEVNKGRNLIYTSMPLLKYAFSISIIIESRSKVY